MNPKKFNYVLIAGSVIITLVGLVIAILFYQGVSKASDNLIIASSSEHQIAARTEALQKLSDKLTEANSVVSTLDLVIPKQKDIPGLLTSLESTAKASGVAINSIDLSVSSTAAATAKGPTPGSTPAASSSASKSASPTTAPSVPASPKGVTEVPFKMEIEGGYASVTNFLSRLSSVTRAVDIDRISITKGKKEADDLKVVLLAKSYAQ